MLEIRALDSPSVQEKGDDQGHSRLQLSARRAGCDKGLEACRVSKAVVPRCTIGYAESLSTGRENTKELFGESSSIQYALDSFFINISIPE
jgi:hypothetical protein